MLLTGLCRHHSKLTLRRRGIELQDKLSKLTGSLKVTKGVKLLLQIRNSLFLLECTRKVKQTQFTNFNRDTIYKGLHIVVTQA